MAVPVSLLLRDSVRTWTRRPQHLIVACAILSVGIAASNSAVELIHSLVFKDPVHVKRPDELYVVPAITEYTRFLDLSDRTAALQLAAYVRIDRPFHVGGTSGDASIECVTAGYFTVLGVDGQEGQLFRASDSATAASPTVIISARFARRYFSSNSSALGTSLVFGTTAYRVVGVTPQGFNGLEERPVDAWVRLDATPANCSFTGESLLFSSRSSWLTVVARLKTDATLSQGTSEVLSVSHSSEGLYGYGAGEPALKSIGEVRAHRLRQFRRVGLWLFGAATAVLLIACANVGGLLLIRGVERRREFAIRRSLGSSTHALVGAVVAENLLLGVLASGFAILLSIWIIKGLTAFFPVDIVAGAWGAGRVAAASAVSLVAIIVCSLAPALQTARTTASSLSRGNDPAEGTRSVTRTASVFIQVVFSVVLCICAGLFQRSVNSAKEGVGYDLENVIVVAPDLKSVGYRSVEDIKSLFSDLLERLRVLPDVEAASLSAEPLLGSGSASTLVFIGSSFGKPLRTAQVLSAVSPDYFRTMKTSLLNGREFSAEDVDGAPPVAIVDETIAKALWTSGSAIDQCLFLSDACYRVVGISEPRRSLALRSVSGEVFVPLAQARGEIVPQRILLRPTTSRSATIANASAVVRSTVPNLTFVNVRPLEHYADVQTRVLRAGSTMFGVFGITGLVLGAFGLFSTLAFWVRQRRSEIAVRIALGGKPSRIAGLVMRQGIGIVLPALFTGLLAAAFVARYLQHLLFRVSPYDKTVFCVAAAVVLIASIAGCAIPTFQAIRVDPARGLRHD